MCFRANMLNQRKRYPAKKTISRGCREIFSFLNHVDSNRTQIVYTIFRLFWYRTEFLMVFPHTRKKVNTTRIRFNSCRDWENVCLSVNTSPYARRVTKLAKFTQRNIFEILLYQTEIRLYLPFSDWFGTTNVQNYPRQTKFGLLLQFFDSFVYQTKFRLVHMIKRKDIGIIIFL